MKVQFINHADPRQSHLVVTAEDPEDTLRVKRLPGRSYVEGSDVWIVPVTIGLTEALERSESPLGVGLLSIIEAKEEQIRDSVTHARSFTLKQAEEISAAEAVEAALIGHLMTVHHGDLADYVYNHGPIDEMVPEIKTPRKAAKRGRKPFYKLH